MSGSPGDGSLNRLRGPHPLRGAALVVFLIPFIASASQQGDGTAANTVASAFVGARQVAHLSKLERIDTNPFRKQVCNHDLRMPSGLIADVHYETSDPASLPDSALRLATSLDGYKVAARFGIGICSVGPSPAGKATYSVLIATYESRWTSFWRTFWN